MCEVWRRFPSHESDGIEIFWRAARGDAAFTRALSPSRLFGSFALVLFDSPSLRPASPRANCRLTISVVKTRAVVYPLPCAENLFRLPYFAERPVSLFFSRPFFAFSLFPCFQSWFTRPLGPTRINRLRCRLRQLYSLRALFFLFLIASFSDNRMVIEILSGVEITGCPKYRIVIAI